MFNDLIKRQLPRAIDRIDLREFGEVVSGKVRDSIRLDGKRILVASDRLSCFDRIITTVPFKGEVLTGLANFWFQKTEHIAENHVIDLIHPQVLVAREVEIVPVEVVVRGYLTGSAWRSYQKGEDVSGITLPPGMKEYQKFEEPLFTPSTKAPMGDHDEPVSEKEILERKIIDQATLEEIKEKAFALFKFASNYLEKNGIILVDTKFEFGLSAGKVVLADEVFTLDSSRFWVKESLEGGAPKMLDKEPARQYLLKQGFSGEGEIPKISDAYREELSHHYISSYATLTGISPSLEAGDKQEEIKKAIKSYLS